MEPEDVAEAREKAEAAELEALEVEHALRYYMANFCENGPGAALARLNVKANLLRSLAVDAFLTLRARVEMCRDMRSQSEAGSEAVLARARAGEFADEAFRETYGLIEASRLAAYVAELRAWVDGHQGNMTSDDIREVTTDFANELEALFLGGPREPANEESR
jgi:hypothetical protein